MMILHKICIALFCGAIGTVYGLFESTVGYWIMIGFYSFGGLVLIWAIISGIKFKTYYGYWDW